MVTQLSYLSTSWYVECAAGACSYDLSNKLSCYLVLCVCGMCGHRLGKDIFQGEISCVCMTALSVVAYFDAVVSHRLPTGGADDHGLPKHSKKKIRLLFHIPWMRCVTAWAAVILTYFYPSKVFAHIFRAIKFYREETCTLYIPGHTPSFRVRTE